ncbi:MAG: FAD:protein FMN transferase [Thiomicrorhabdus sp.]|nr:FAD:protein FMN transferase [Thiomicrorhabdus sp.]
MITLSSCTTPQDTEHKATLVVFGTFVEILIFTPPHQSKQANAAIKAVERQFHQFHQQWHAWEQGGIVSKINQAIALQQPIEVADSVKHFIVTSQTLTQQSQNLFDPGIGQLVDLWGFHSETWQGPPPSQQQIQAWLNQRPSLLDISFTGNTLTSSNPNVQLDFGGNAKGLAIEMALASLQKSGIQNAIVSIGGDMKAIGSKHGDPWKVGIQNPQQPTQVLASIELKSGESVMTSGIYQRYFESQGQRFSHILNPKTGYPAQSFSSVTVIHPNAITADAAATALLIAGKEQWLSIAESMGIQYVFSVDKHGKIFQTDAMAQRLTYKIQRPNQN